MVQKTVIKGKSIHICDICGNEIPLDSKDNLSLTIQSSWYNTFGYKNIDICKKHKKEVIKFINKLEHNTSEVEENDK